MLKVVSVLLIIFSIIALISSIATLGSITLVAEWFDVSLSFLLIIFFLPVAMNLIAGIIGVVGRNAKVCQTMGVVMIISHVLISIIGIEFVGGIAIVTGLLLPILYIMGADKQKNVYSLGKYTGRVRPQPPKLPQYRNETLDDIMAEIGAETAYNEVYDKTHNHEVATRAFWDIYNRRYMSPEDIETEMRANSAYNEVYNKTHNDKLATDAFWEDYYKRYE